MNTAILLPIFSILLCGSKTCYGRAQQTLPSWTHLGNQNSGQFLPPNSANSALTSGKNLPNKRIFTKDCSESEKY